MGLITELDASSISLEEMTEEGVDLDVEVKS
jgi:hypothetical protein